MLGRPRVSLAMALLPVLFVLALHGLIDSLDPPSTSPRPLAFEHCSAIDVHGRPDPTAPCISIVYAPSAASGAVSGAGAAYGPTDGDGEYGDAIMSRLATMYGLRWDGGAGVTGDRAASADIIGAPSAGAAGRMLYDSFGPNGVQIDAIVVFEALNGSTAPLNASWPTGADWVAGVYGNRTNVTLPLPVGSFGLGSASRGPALGQISYTIWVNASRQEVYARNGMDEVWRATGHPGRILALQAAVDGAVVAEGTARLRADKASRTGASGTGGSANVGAGGSFSWPGSTPSVSDLSSPVFSPSLGAFSDFNPGSDKGLSLGAATGGVTPAQAAFLFAGTTFPVLGVVLSSLLVLLLVSAEKAAKLVAHLRSVGLYESTYWLSWWLSALPIWLVMALVTPAVAVAVQLPVWTDAEFGIHVLALFLLGASCTALTLAVSSCVRSPRPVNIMSFLIFALALALTMFATIGGIYSNLYSPAFPAAGTAILTLFPWVNYGRVLNGIQMWKLDGILADLAQEADTSADPSTVPDASVTTSTLYGWTELTKEPAPITTLVRGLPVSWTDRPAGFSMAMMVVDVLVWLVVAWYFGQVMTGDLGAALPWWFPLDAAYWRGMPSRSRSGDGRGADSTDTLSRLRAASAANGSLITHKLSKGYGKVTALKEVSIGLAPGQLLALLGQNGAGKTTLVNILAGVIQPTAGEAYLSGFDLRTEANLLRDRIGCCPQDDLLWDALTAREHVTLFARFKGVQPSTMQDHVASLLRQVGLEDVADQPVRTFSGGMKRRLSIAQAAVGSPSIVFLDEPGSGLDPLNRRQVWKIIQSLKPGRLVVLTTHDMAEADALGDTVAILAGGRLRALGSALYLKSRFGRGYAVSMLVDPGRLQEAKTLVSKHLPGAEIIGDGVHGQGGAAAAAAVGPAWQVQGQAPAGMSTGATLSPAVATGATTPSARPSSLFNIRIIGGKGKAPAASPAVTGGPGQWPVLPSAAASGAFTVSVPRSLLPLLPSFLRVLQSHSWGNATTVDDGHSAPSSAEPTSGTSSSVGIDSSTAIVPLIREWGVSNSSLEEVFLRLAAADAAVNAPLGDGRGQGSVGQGTAGIDALALAQGMTGPAGTAAHAGAAAPAHGTGGNGQTGAVGRVCALCESALAVPVTVFTSTQVDVTAPDLLCAACVGRTRAEIDTARIAGGRPALFKTSGREAKGGGAAAGAGPGHAADALAGDVSLDSTAATSSVVPTAFEPVSTDAAVSAPSDWHPVGSATIALVTTVGRAQQEGAGTGSCTVNPLVETAAQGKPALIDDAVSKMRKDSNQAAVVPRVTLPGSRPRQVVDPVSQSTQAFAVLALRLQLQAKSRIASCCQLCTVLIAVALTLLFVPVPPSAGLYCPDTGFYYQNVSLGAGAYGSSVTTSSSLTYYNSFMGSNVADQNLCDRTTFANWAAKAEAHTSEQGRSLATTAFSQGQQVRRTHQPSCVVKNADGECNHPYVRSQAFAAFERVVYARLPDWQQVSMWPSLSLSGSDVDNKGVATIWYSDSDSGSMAEGHVPMRSWDLVGAGLPPSVPHAPHQSWTSRNVTVATQTFYDPSQRINKGANAYTYMGVRSPSPTATPRPSFSSTPGSSPTRTPTRTPSPTPSPAAFPMFSDWLPGAVRWVDRAAPGAGPGVLPHVSRSDAAMDSDFLESQRQIFVNSKSLNNSCRRFGIGTGTGGISNRLAWQWDDGIGLQDWMSARLPAAAVAVTKARPGASTPSLAYTMRTYALKSQNSNSYRPERQNKYSWLNALALRATYETMVTSLVYDPNTNIYMYSSTLANTSVCGPVNFYATTDDPWAIANQPAPAPVILSALHNALFRATVESQGLWSDPLNGTAAIWAATAAGASVQMPPLPREPVVSIRTNFAHVPPVLWLPEGNVPGPKDATTAAYAGLIWPLFTMYLLPTLAYPISAEKAGRQYGALRMAGMGYQAYFAGHYLFAFGFTAVQLAIFILSGWGVGSPLFTSPSPGLLSALVIAWAHAQASYAILLGSIMSSPRLASLAGYLVLVVVSVGHFLITMFVEPLPSGFAWWPLFSYARASFLALAYGGKGLSAATELSSALAATFIEGLAALLLAVYLHAVLPGPDGGWAPSPPWYPCQTCLRRFQGRSSGGKAARSAHGRKYPAFNGQGDKGASLTFRDVVPVDGIASSGSHSGISAAGPLDRLQTGARQDPPDVVQEQAMADAALTASAVDTSSHAFALHLIDLVKRFPSTVVPSLPRLETLRATAAAQGTAAALRQLGQAFYRYVLASIVPATEDGPRAKVAVDGLSLAVPYGETLGLLGPNGAGKTTSLAVLTGGTSLTDGDARVSGWSVATDRNRVWRLLGVCPQFDTVWDELTVAQHLALYARIKGFTTGMNSGQIAAMVRTAAERVELDGDAFGLAASELSGGMRRRLSIAIALLGDPAVVLLDEPTTGLDPETKTHIHRIIAAQKSLPGRAMVITTHSMDEADALCSRIAIIAGGRLRAIGTQQTLKARYGRGYKLVITLPMPAVLSSDAAQDPYAGPAAVLHEWLCSELVATVQAAVARASEQRRPSVVNGRPTRPVLPLPQLVGRVGATATYLLPSSHADDDEHQELSLANAAATTASWDLSATFAALESIKRQGEQALQSGAQAGADDDRPAAGGDTASGAGKPRAMAQPLLLDFGLSQTSLDEVFVAVVTASGSSPA